jgi:DNA-directed RNA polymerase III subunit RPC7
MVNTAEEGQDGEDRDGDGAAKQSTGRSLLDRLEELRGDEDDEAGIDVEDEDLAEDDEEEDEVYDDEDAGDYDAENYFDNGDEMGDDYGDGDDGEGTF